MSALRGREPINPTTPVPSTLPLPPSCHSSIVANIELAFNKYLRKEKREKRDAEREESVGNAFIKGKGIVKFFKIDVFRKRKN